MDHQVTLNVIWDNFVTNGTKIKIVRCAKKAYNFYYNSISSLAIVIEMKIFIKYKKMLSMFLMISLSRSRVGLVFIFCIIYSSRPRPVHNSKPM